jgi:hypothetical protein
VLSQLIGIIYHQVTPGDNGIGIDIVPKLPSSACQKNPLQKVDYPPMRKVYIKVIREESDKSGQRLQFFFRGVFGPAARTSPLMFGLLSASSPMTVKK